MFAFLHLMAILSFALNFETDATLHPPKCNETLIEQINNYWQSNGGVPKNIHETVSIYWEHARLQSQLNTDVSEPATSCLENTWTIACYYLSVAPKTIHTHKLTIQCYDLCWFWYFPIWSIRFMSKENQFLILSTVRLLTSLFCYLEYSDLLFS